MNGSWVAIGSALAIALSRRVAKAGSRGFLSKGRTACASCSSSSDYSVRALYNTMKDCGFYLPESQQIFEELAENPANPVGLGSLARLRVTYTYEERLDAAESEGTITAKQNDSYRSMIAYLAKKEDTSLAENMKELVSKLTPYQLMLLTNLNVLTKGRRSNYSEAAGIARMVGQVNSRIFINRYLQRTAFLIPQSKMDLPIFVDPENWKKKWCCREFAALEKGKTLESIIDKYRKQLNRYRLDLNVRRLEFKRTRTGDYLDTRLEPFGSLTSLADVAWFIEMAKACGVMDYRELLHTYPIENIWTGTDSSVKSKRIGDTVFDRMKYGLHLPVLKEGSVSELFPTTDAEFPQLGAEHIVYGDPNITKPYIYYYSMEKEPVVVCFYSYSSGALTSQRCPVFTKTSKMNTISFSIPAGPPAVGGSCIASAVSAPSPGLGVNGKNYVCQTCYALRNRYQMLDYIFSSAPRFNWLFQVLQSGANSDTVLARLLSLAIESYARYAYEDDRGTLEIGFTQDNDLVYRSTKENFASIDPCSLTIGGNSQSFIDFRHQNEVAGYLRIHDSGDFTISNNSTYNKLYISAWSQVAGTFPQVQFWAPTRAWSLGYQLLDSDELQVDSVRVALAQIQKGLGRVVAQKLGMGRILQESRKLWMTYVLPMDAACELNPNLAIRPSGLTVVNPFNASFIKIPSIRLIDPAMASISAGSGVNAVLQKTSSGNGFTASTFSALGYDDAYPPNTKNRGTVKKEIQEFLVSYVRKVYGKWPKYAYTPIQSMSGEPVYQCPVNKKTNAKGDPIVSGDSCMSSNCRYCWLRKDGFVTYGEH